jgi:cephalosporin-C deacetylase-like acetyl esterase
MKPKRLLVPLLGLLLLVVIAATTCFPDGMLFGQAPAVEASNAENDLAAQLRDLDANIFPPDDAAVKELPRMLARDVRSRMQAANLRENQAWQAVKTRADWEQFRDVRLQALREALGRFPPVPKALKVRVTRTLEGDGYRIENLVFESRPGLVVTANLYTPANPPRSMPGILIAHSHHNPKTQGELQDMGMTWARQGCLVLVPDELGHGERRQHPFQSEKDYPHSFRVGRQDYYFRYNTGLQLQVVGDSLMGWMAWDLMRCVDLLLARPGIDKERIFLLGAVAGGGDQAAVAAALDPRITAVAPFNFGGPQPDYAIPNDAERDFYYFGVAYWESTRCLRRGARDGFAQWLIVGSVAPRGLIYGQEFAWDEERDPVWPRLKQVYAWYDAADHLATAAGRGSLKGSPPESSHANNIGPLHRSKIYPSLQRWFDLPIPEEYSRRRNADELLCLTPEAAREFKPRPLHELAAAVGAGRAAEARQRRASLSLPERRKKLCQVWANLLGEVEPTGDPKLLERKEEITKTGTLERLALEVDRDVVVPAVLLVPPHKAEMRLPLVMGLAQAGKQEFLKQRSEEIAELLNGGAAVCLVDVRGTGETRPADGSRGRTGTAIDVSATEGLLGQTLVGSRLRDVRSVLRYLRGRTDLDASRIGLWGDSFAPTNSPDANLAVPLDAEPFPKLAEPLGGLLALFGALYEEDARAVYIHGGLTGYGSLLHSPFCYIPHDAIIPGALTEGDLCDVAAVLAPRPLRMSQMIDGLNREVSAKELEKTFATTSTAYASLQGEARFQLEGEAPANGLPARWMVRGLKAD